MAFFFPVGLGEALLQLLAQGLEVGFRVMLSVNVQVQYLVQKNSIRRVGAGKMKNEISPVSKDVNK